MPPPKKKLRPIQAVNRSDRLGVRLAEVRALFRFLDRVRPGAIPAGELSIVFMDQGEHNLLHKQFLDDETPTDVITFSGDPAMDFAGEICVSTDFAKKSAKERKLPFSSELTLYLIHGWLHLAGYKDKTKAEQKVMREQETQLQKEVKKANLTPIFQTE